MQNAYYAAFSAECSYYLKNTQTYTYI